MERAYFKALNDKARDEINQATSKKIILNRNKPRPLKNSK